MKHRRDQLRPFFQAVVGGILAGVGLLHWGILFMPFGIALLWPASRNPVAGGVWGATAILISHSWLLYLHPISWIGVSDELSLLITIFIWFFCGSFGALLVWCWSVLGQVLLRTRNKVTSSKNNIFWILIMASIWGIGEAILSQTPLFWIGLSTSILPEDRYFAGLARWIGAGGLSTLLLLIGWWIWQIAVASQRGIRWQGFFWIGFMSILSSHLIGLTLLQKQNLFISKPLAVWQPSVPIREKFSDANLKRLPLELQDSLKHAEELGALWMIAPEGTLGVSQNLLSPPPIPLLTGGFRAVEGAQRSSLLVFDSQEIKFSNAVDKYRLVPLGEWIPNFLTPFLRNISAIGGLQSGAPSRLLNWSGPSAAVSICYEISDGHSLSLAIREGAEWIVAIANLDPYPLSLQRQFLSLAQLRSIELKKDLISASNTGPSSLILSSGEIFPIVSPMKEGVGITNVQLNNKITGYIKWGETPLIVTFTIGLIGFYRSKLSLSFMSKDQKG